MLTITWDWIFLVHKSKNKKHVNHKSQLVSRGAYFIPNTSVCIGIKAKFIIYCFVHRILFWQKQQWINKNMSKQRFPTAIFRLRMMQGLSNTGFLAEFYQNTSVQKSIYTCKVVQRHWVIRQHASIANLVAIYKNCKILYWTTTCRVCVYCIHFQTMFVALVLRGRPLIILWGMVQIEKKNSFVSM